MSRSSKKTASTTPPTGAATPIAMLEKAQRTPKSRKASKPMAPDTLSPGETPKKAQRTKQSSKASKPAAPEVLSPGETPKKAQVTKKSSKASKPAAPEVLSPGETPEKAQGTKRSPKASKPAEPEILSSDETPKKAQRTKKSPKASKPVEPETLPSHETPEKAQGTKKSPKASKPAEPKAPSPAETPGKAQRTQKSPKASKPADPEVLPSGETPEKPQRTKKSPKASKPAAPESLPSHETPEKAKRIKKSPKASEPVESEVLPPDETPKKAQGTKKSPKASKPAAPETLPSGETPKKAQRTKKSPKASKSAAPEVLSPGETPKKAQRTKKSPKASEPVEPEVLPPDEPPEKDPDEKNEGDGDLEPDEGAEPDDIVDIDDLPDLDKDFGDGLAITDDAGTPDDPASTLPAPSQTRLPKPKATRDNLFLYIKEISKFPLLTPEEEQSLARKVRDKADPDAAFRLVSSHLRLVVRIAMDFQRRWMENVLDLIQEGNEGLVRAVNKFDPNRGIKFSYYATFWIKAYILKFIMDNWRMVKLGTTREQRKVFYNLHRERQNLAAQGYDADNAALSERMGVPEAVIAEMDKRLSSADVSLNTRVGKDEDGSSHMDFLPALGPGVEQNLALREMADIVRAHLKTFIPTLNERERYILENRLLAEEPVSLRQIGERYNVTRERIRQYEIRLLEKFRQHISLDIKDFSEAWIR